jgi:hypothetical protein
MKKLVTAAAFIAATLAAQTSFATVYNEVGDAGQTLATTQMVSEGTTSIVGSLGSGDGADVYKFNWNGGTFQASTSTNFDPMLFVFDSNGTKLAFNDDSSSLESFISISLTAGTYLLGIDNYSYNYDGDLSGFAGLQSGYGNYTITLSETAAVPEPSAIALLGLGLFGLSLSRRRKAS